RVRVCVCVCMCVCICLCVCVCVCVCVYVCVYVCVSVCSVCVCVCVCVDRGLWFGLNWSLACNFVWCVCVWVRGRQTGLAYVSDSQCPHTLIRTAMSTVPF